MQVTDVERSELEFKAKVTIYTMDIAIKTQEQLKGLSAKAKIDGFRPGKVPMSIMQKKYGDSAKQDVLQKMIQDAITKVISDNNIDTIGSPKITDLQMEEGKDVQFTIEVELKPSAKLPNFKAINIERPVIKPAKKDIDKALEHSLKVSTTYEEEKKDEPIEINDRLTINAKGYIDDKEFAGGTINEGHLIIGSKNFIDNFEDQLIGSKVGDHVTVNVTFPENYHAKDLSGKKARFEVEILKAYKPSQAELNDEFFKKFDCENLKQLRAKIEDSMRQEFTKHIETYLKMELFDYLEDALNFPVPKSMIADELKILVNNIKTDKELAALKEKKAPEELDKYLEDIALRRVRIGLMLSRYVSDKGIVASGEDISKSIAEHAQGLPQNEQQMIYEYYQNNKDALEQVRSAALEDKAVNRIINEEINLTDKDYNIKELEELFSKAHKKYQF
ncbi:MAG: trigger factor [Rickettsiaceae bacterium]